MSNRAEWAIADFACVQRGYVVVPLAVTDGVDALEAIVRECGVRVVVCESNRAEDFRLIGTRVPELERIVLASPADDPDDGCRTLEDLERAGASLETVAPAARAADDLYTLLFTSGSTGRPKGAMRTYGSFTALVGSYGAAQPAVHLSFQPYSHLSERMMTPTIVRFGGQIGFASGDPARLFEDISLLRPTTIGGVPRVFDVLHAQYRQLLAQHREAHPAQPEEEATREVMASVRELFGDRLQTVGVGSAKSSAALLEFLRECFGDCHVMDGYGSTEVGTITLDGAVQASVEVRLVDIPELGYLSSDEPPRGEICVKTPHMISGYFGQRDGAFDTDGFFATGDIGERGADGRVRIIGRRKHVVKLSQGEFVSPEQIEATLQASPVVDQIYVHADPLEAFVVALVVPDGSALFSRFPELDVEDWRTRDESAASVVRALAEVARERGLPRYETPLAVHLLDEPMTADNGLMTSSHKPDRRAIAARFEGELSSLNQRARGTATSAEAELVEAVKSVAGELGSDLDFAALGIDSMARVQLLTLLEERLDREVPVDALLAASSLEDFARRLQQGGDDARRLARADLALSVDLPEAIALPADGRPSRLLLTGATGFLGMGLLESLLARTEARVSCLVRASSDEAALGRLRERAATS